MKFSVGDQVVPPRHGAGQITDIEELELVEGFKHYYMIEIGNKGLVLHVPVRKMEALGVRPVMSSTRLDHVLETLRSDPSPLATNYRVRQTELWDKLETGHPQKIAEAVRDLTWRKRKTSLSANDIVLLKRGRELLALEIAVVMNIGFFEARRLIATALISSKTTKQEVKEPEKLRRQNLQAEEDQSRNDLVTRILYSQRSIAA